MIHGVITKTDNIVDAVSNACSVFSDIGLAASLSPEDAEKLQLFMQNSDVNAKNQNGDSLLHIAAKSMEYRILAMLIERNATIQLDSNGKTPLDILLEGALNERPYATEALDQFLFAIMNKIKASGRWDFLKEHIESLNLKYADEDVQQVLEEELNATNESLVDKMVLSAHKFTDPQFYTDEEAMLIDLQVYKFIEQQYANVALLKVFSITPLLDRLFDSLVDDEPANTFIPSGAKPNSFVADAEVESDDLELTLSGLSLSR